MKMYTEELPELLIKMKEIIKRYSGKLVSNDNHSFDYYFKKHGENPSYDIIYRYLRWWTCFNGTTLNEKEFVKLKESVFNGETYTAILDLKLMYYENGVYLEVDDSSVIINIPNKFTLSVLISVTEACDPITPKFTQFNYIVYRNHFDNEVRIADSNLWLTVNESRVSIRMGMVMLALYYMTNQKENIVEAGISHKKEVTTKT